MCVFVYAYKSGSYANKIVSHTIFVKIIWVT